MKLTVKEAAKQLNISKEAIYNRIRRGTLKSEKIGDLTYVILEDQQDLSTIIEELKSENEALKLEIAELKKASTSLVPVKQKWLLLDEYLQKFKKKHREKVRKYILKRIFKSKKIKIEENKIYIKNKKLSKI